MKQIVGISLLLVGLGIWSCNVEGSASQDRGGPPAFSWVRTADGWERAGEWRIEEPTLPRLHPVVVAAGQGLFSVLALVAFSWRSAE